MTENEAIKELKSDIEICSSDCDGACKYFVKKEYSYECTCLKAVSLNALEEIQQYRAIGTVKEIKIKEAQFARLSEGYLNDLSLLREYQAIGTIEELKALTEKSVAKKPLNDGMQRPFSYYCPNCKEELSDDGYEPDEEYCCNCGQHILIEN